MKTKENPRDKIDYSNFLVCRLRGRNWSHSGNCNARFPRAEAIRNCLVYDGEPLEVSSLAPAKVSAEEWFSAAKESFPILERRARLAGHHKLSSEELRGANPELSRAFGKVRTILVKGETTS